MDPREIVRKIWNDLHTELRSHGIARPDAEALATETLALMLATDFPELGTAFIQAMSGEQVTYDGDVPANLTIAAAFEPPF